MRESDKKFNVQTSQLYKLNKENLENRIICHYY